MDIFSVNQKEIYENFGGIELSSLLKKRWPPLWAFSNEKLLNFSKLTSFQGKTIFAIGSSGDQAITFLGWGAKNCLVCDKKDLACLFIEFKLAALKNLSFQEVLRIFGLRKPKNHQRDQQIYQQKIRKDISEEACNFFDYLFLNSRNIYQSLKKSKFFYRESWHFAKKGYLPYLENPYLFQKIKNIRKPVLLNTNLIDGLKFPNLKFDLIYLSNVLDTREYLKDPFQVWRVLSEHLTKKGQILMVSQRKLRKIAGSVQKFGFRVTKVLKTKVLFYPFSRGYPYLYLLIERD